MTGRLREQSVRVLHGRYAPLALALVFLGIMYPLLGMGVAGLSAWTAAFWSVLMGALHAVGMRGRARRIALSLAALAILSGASGLLCYALDLASHGWLFVLFDGLTFVFLALATGEVLLDVLFGDISEADELMGVACAYVLLGLTFAYLLPVVGSLTGEPVFALADSSADTDPGLARAEYLYFSFVTLSTLGYGDLAPGSLTGRLIASAEAIIGQLFLTIFVARLIGSHVVRGRTERTPAEAGSNATGNNDTDHDDTDHH